MIERIGDTVLAISMVVIGICILIVGVLMWLE